MKTNYLKEFKTDMLDFVDEVEQLDSLVWDARDDENLCKKENMSETMKETAEWLKVHHFNNTEDYISTTIRTAAKILGVEDNDIPLIFRFSLYEWKNVKIPTLIAYLRPIEQGQYSAIFHDPATWGGDYVQPVPSKLNNQCLEFMNPKEKAFITNLNEWYGYMDFDMRIEIIGTEYTLRRV